MRRAVGLLAIAMALALTSAASAGGGSTGILILAGPGLEHSRQTAIPFHATGSLVMRFQGDQTAGCEALGICGYTGTVTWTPPDGSVNLIQFGPHHRSTRAVLFFDEFQAAGADAIPVAQVHRGSAGVCGDVNASEFGFFDLAVRRGRVNVAIRKAPGEGVIQTRCAGPLGSDLAHLTPVRAVSVARLLRGRMTLDLSGTRAFRAPGFAGAIESSLVLHLGAPQRLNNRPPPGERTRLRRRRVVTVRYAVEQLAGVDRISFAGLPDPLCGPLDSCGSRGTVAVSPNATTGHLIVEAEAPASRPRRDLYAAVGLREHGRRSGVNTYGFGRWISDRGISSETLTRRDGSPTCRDAIAVDAGELTIQPHGSQVRVSTGSFYQGPDPLRTRCPGPFSTDLSPSGNIASGGNPLGALRRRRVVLHLNRRRRLSGDGYSGVAAPELTLVLRRTSVKERVIVERIPVGP